MAENFDAIIEKEAELHGTHVGDDQTSTNSGEDVVKVFNAIQEEIKSNYVFDNHRERAPSERDLKIKFIFTM